MLASISQGVRSTTRGQLLIGEKSQNRTGERVAIAWLDEQTIFTVFNNFRNITDLGRDERTTTGEGFP